MWKIRPTFVAEWGDAPSRSCPIWLAPASVNHKLPSGPAVAPASPVGAQQIDQKRVGVVKRVRAPVAGTTRPTPSVREVAILPANHRLPSGPTVSESGWQSHR